MLSVDTDTDTLLTKKAWAPQGINDIHVQWHKCQFTRSHIIKIIPVETN